MNIDSSAMPVAIASDGTTVFWSESQTTDVGTGNPNDDGAIRSCPVSGGTATAVVPTGLQYPLALSVDATSVYFVDNGDSTHNSTLGLVARTGGSVTALATSGGVVVWVAGLAIDTADVYYGEALGTTEVLRMPLGGGTATTLGSEVNLGDLFALQGSTLFVAGTDGIYSMPKSGGTVTRIATSTDPPAAFAVDPTSVYWVDNQAGTLMSVPVGGGSASTLASGENDPYFVVADGTSVYWIDRTPGLVKKLTLASRSTTTIATGLSYPNSMALDATALYWGETEGLFRLAK